MVSNTMQENTITSSQCDGVFVFLCFCVCHMYISLAFRRGNEPSFGSAPRRMGGGRRLVDDASEEEADSQNDFNGTKSSE